MKILDHYLNSFYTFNALQAVIFLHLQLCLDGLRKQLFGTTVSRTVEH